MDPEIAQTLIQVFGTGGALLLAIKVLASKLAEQYDARMDQYNDRVEALEESSARCEADRTSLHSRIETILIEQNDLKKKLTKG